MILIKNEPMQTESTGVTTTTLRFRADTFVVTSGHSLSPVLGLSSAMSARARTFADEKAAFESLLPIMRARYAGHWVAISDGRVLEYDCDRKALTRRVFSGPQRRAVYIGFVGTTPTIRQVSPFRARPRA